VAKKGVEDEKKESQQKKKKAPVPPLREGKKCKISDERIKNI